ncbi:MAG TPA: DUF3891 family protein [Candidatus Angelobacter sp.]|nr:DUF3891 family protein [Candidatus Angelobacter sp.]
MILRPLTPVAPSGQEFAPAWPVVQRTQKQKYQQCWLITQPSHAALAGELAAQVTAPNLPAPDAGMIRAIALHDAGWGVPDAQAIMFSRSVAQTAPDSFASVPAHVFLDAWEKSIDIAQSVSPAGGYIVSRHFCRIGGHYTESHNAENGMEKRDRQQLSNFLDQEAKRQKKLAAAQTLSHQELEQFTDLLQFCDLLSLYMCCGAQESVALPEYFGTAVRVTVEESGYRLGPPLIAAGAEFSVAALRHPATKELSSQELLVRIA